MICSMKELDNDSIVISGMGIVSAAAVGTESFQCFLRSGRSAVSAVPDRGIYAAQISERAFRDILCEAVGGISSEKVKEYNSVVRRMPAGIQYAAAAAAEAYHAADIDRITDRKRISVIGAGSNIFQNYAYLTAEQFKDRPEFVTPSYALQFMDTNLTGVISRLFNIRGEGFTVGGASASSLAAVVKARQLLEAGYADVCLVIGTVSELSPIECNAFRNLGALISFSEDIPADEACRPFDKAHRGFVLGEAAACLVLERRSHDGLRDGDIILSSAVMSLDANHLSDPTLEGEMAVMRDAMLSAGIGPSDIDYINAHGTGTPLGDTIEAKAIEDVFSGENAVVNSDKPLFGHCLNTAGLCEIISSVIQMKEGFAHGCMNLTEPVSTQVHFSPKDGEKRNINYCLKNAFGFGGINSACVLHRFGGTKVRG